MMTAPAQPLMFHSKSIVLAAVFAAGLFGADRAAQAEPIMITCGFGSDWGGSGDDEGCAPDFEGSPEGAQRTAFHWSDYLFRLTLYGVDGTGSISVIDNPMDEETFQSKLEEPPIDIDVELLAALAFSSPDSYTCIPMVDPAGDSAPCRDFVITPSGSLEWDRYDFAIDWDWDSQNNGYDGTGGRARVLRDIDTDGFYDEDMCIEAGGDLGDDNYVPCIYSPFPIIISGDTDFSTVTAAIATGVPEPASVALLGTGLIALWYRRRQS
jgi:hypothetical protein